LWSANVTIPGVTITTGQVGFAASELVATGATPTAYDAAEAAGEKVLVPMGPDEASALVAAGDAGMAWMFEVSMAATGNAGMEYSVEPDFTEGGVLAGAIWKVFPVASAAACVVPESLATSSYPTDIPGIPTTYAGLKEVTAQVCVTAVFDPAANVAGTYSNTAEVAAVGPDGSNVEATDTWTADLFPDPGSESSTGGLLVSHSVTMP
jgi:hypothetical protein